MEKKDYLVKVYIAARAAGLCKTQGEFAALVGLNQSTISKAMQGDEKYLTDNLVKRIRLWADNVLEKHEEPKPDIVIPAETVRMYENLTETIRLQAEMLSRLGAGTVPGFTSPKNYRIETD